MSDSVDRMMKSVNGLCTPLQDVILREAVTDRSYANLAAAELESIRAQLAEAVNLIAEAKVEIGFSNALTDKPMKSSKAMYEKLVAYLQKVTPVE